MQQFVMMVGLPGSGKDTFIKNNIDFENFIIVSSDKIRDNNGYLPDEVKNTFNICRQQIDKYLSLGENVIFNATNLKRKHRVHLLNYLHNKFDNIDYICVLIITPIKVCKERNAQRIGFDKVPEKVIDRMVRTFQIPMEGEGFNKIFYRAPGYEDYVDEYSILKGRYISARYDDVYYFNQDNPHHTLSLGNHMDKTFDYIWDKIPKYFPGHYAGEPQFRPLLTTALYHDIGKMITKDYHDAKGNLTTTAHYYGHENAGAYLVLSEFAYIWDEQDGVYNFDTLVKIATYINFHMRVSFVWKDNPSSIKVLQEKKMFSDFDLKCLELLGEADRYAHQ